MLLYECHQKGDLEGMRTIQLKTNREKQGGRRVCSRKWTVFIVLLICELLVNGTPPSAVPVNIQTVSVASTGTAACEILSVDFV